MLSMNKSSLLALLIYHIDRIQIVFDSFKWMNEQGSARTFVQYGPTILKTAFQAQINLLLGWPGCEVTPGSRNLSVHSNFLGMNEISTRCIKEGGGRERGWKEEMAEWVLGNLSCCGYKTEGVGRSIVCLQPQLVRELPGAVASKSNFASPSHTG